MSIRFGYSSRAIRVGPVSARLPVRVCLTSLALLGVAVGLGLMALALGDYPIPLPDVLAVLGGAGEPFDRTVVLSWRLPIALMAVVFGACSVLVARSSSR